MLGLDVRLEGDGCWPDLAWKPVVKAELTSIAALSSGMQSGLASVAVRIDLPDGQVVVAETSMRLFLAAAAAFRVKYGEDG